MRKLLMALALILSVGFLGSQSVTSVAEAGKGAVKRRPAGTSKKSARGVSNSRRNVSKKSARGGKKSSHRTPKYPSSSVKQLGDGPIKVYKNQPLVVRAMKAGKSVVTSKKTVAVAAGSLATFGIIWSSTFAVTGQADAMFTKDGWKCFDDTLASIDLFHESSPALSDSFPGYGCPGIIPKLKDFDLYPGSLSSTEAKFEFVLDVKGIDTDELVPKCSSCNRSSGIYIHFTDLNTGKTFDSEKVNTTRSPYKTPTANGWLWQTLDRDQIFQGTVSVMANYIGGSYIESPLQPGHSYSAQLWVPNYRTRKEHLLSEVKFETLPV